MGRNNVFKNINYRFRFLLVFWVILLWEVIKIKYIIKI